MEEERIRLGDGGFQDFGRQILEGGKASVEITQKDFIDFVGNNAKTYLRRFETFYAGGRDKFAFTWHWPAFFLGAIWMAYRKLYGWTLVVFFLSLIPFLGILSWPLIGLSAHYLYYRHTRKKILGLKASKTFSDPMRLSADLCKIGGVNVWAAIVVAVVVIAIQVVFQVLLRAK